MTFSSRSAGSPSRSSTSRTGGTGWRWHDELPEPDTIPELFSGGYDHSAEDHRFNLNLMPGFYGPPE